MQASDLNAMLARIEARGADPVWISRRARAEITNAAATAPAGPLRGVGFAIKDNIDLAGVPTTAGCPEYAYQPATSAPVVKRLIAAGAIPLGKTNLDQFATGLVGVRSPYGVPVNPFGAASIPGGSSSGSAVAVAAGLCDFALGTDTAGSGRVPAACNNLVGFKPAPGSLSTEGLVPACPSLDCVSILALTVKDASAVFQIAAGAPVACASDASVTFAVPRATDLEFFGDSDQAGLFEQALVRLEDQGWQRREVDFAPFREVAALLYEGPWLAERHAALEGILKAHPDDIHPVTRAVLEGGAGYSAGDVFKGMSRLRTLRQECYKTFDQADVLVTPTIPTIPRRSEVHTDSVGWTRRLGDYPNFANLLGLAALSLPTGFTARGLPGGATVFAPAGSEQRLCEWGMSWQRWFQLPLGATRERPALDDGATAPEL